VWLRLHCAAQPKHGVTATACKLFWSRCLWTWLPDVYVINCFVCVCVCVCVLHECFVIPFMSLFLRTCLFSILVVATVRYFCIFKYWVVKCHISLLKKLLRLQNMINERKDFGIWTEYFTCFQDSTFVRRTLLWRVITCITESILHPRTARRRADDILDA
jgi:DMSO/TMAO reductase YedYZ heme-binding membrane subunit